MTIRRLALLVVLASLLVPAGVAQANTYCVGSVSDPACVTKPDFQAALTAAQNNLGPDTVKLGAGPTPFTSGTPFTYSSNLRGNTVAIVGVGGRDGGFFGTSVTVSSSPPATVLTVTSVPGSTISGIGVVVPAGTGNVGIDTNADVTNVAVSTVSPSSGNPVGVKLGTGGSLSDSDVNMSTSLTTTRGVVATGVGALVDGSSIRAGTGIQIPANSVSPQSGTVRHSEIVSASRGIDVNDADYLVEDTVFQTATDNNEDHLGAAVSALNRDSTLLLNHVTMVGSGGVAFESFANGHTAALTFRNSVYTGYEFAFSRSGSTGGPANITTDYSDYTVEGGMDVGPGSFTETNHLTADPGFVSSSDFHLRSDSPLVDAGDPAGLGASESPTDASGQPRIRDGGGDCVARRDVGAFEFQPGQRAPVAVASVATPQAATDQPVQFDASQSCDPDGDALTYAWAFDDGSVGPGVTRERAFSRAGLHFGAVTVTDSTGRSTTAVAAVQVTRPAPPAFAGVTIPKQTVKVSKTGVAAVKLRCPLGTVGACAGTITLSRVGDKKLGSAAVAIARGATRKVNVKLTRRTRSALQKARHLNATAAVSAHDANGTGHRTKGTIKLVAPPGR